LEVYRLQPLSHLVLLFLLIIFAVVPISFWDKITTYLKSSSYRIVMLSLKAAVVRGECN
jgi:hypothetical protein